MSPSPPGTRRFVSTGRLPEGDQVARLVAEAVERFAAEDGGELSRVYPALAAADPSRFGVCVVGVDGRVDHAGDAEVAFPLMSVAKPFTFALACERVGVDEAAARLGVDATGLPFDSVEAVERSGGRTNPMVNPGAMAAVELVGDGPGASWGPVHDGLSAFAGRPLDLDGAVLASAAATNRRNRALAQLLDSFGVLEGDPLAVLDVYTRQSSLAVTALDLAVMGATLADGGVNPVTGVSVVGSESCHAALAVMATAGLYETSGTWLYRVGLPAKSGIGGGIVTVAPGKGGLGTWSPPLDAAGNSVRGQHVAAFLAQRLGMDLFASEPYRGEVATPQAGVRQRPR